MEFTGGDASQRILIPQALCPERREVAYAARSALGNGGPPRSPLARRSRGLLLFLHRADQRVRIVPQPTRALQQ